MAFYEVAQVGQSRGQFVGTVILNENICTEHYRLRVRMPGFPASVPGQFVQLDCGNETAPFVARVAEEMEVTPGARAAFRDADLLGPLAYLRRPFSIARHTPGAEGAEIDVIHRVVGKGTRYLEALRLGDTVNLLGPLGKGFAIPEGTRTALLVGGGVGVPPMFYLAEYLRRVRPEMEAIGFLGAQRRDLLALPTAEGRAPADGAPTLHAGEFGELGYKTAIATDDGSYGLKGFVTQALQNYLRGQSGEEREVTTVFCCGPTPMMKATARVAQAFGVTCLVSLEQPMACGMGTCQSCVIKYQPEGVAEWVYKLTCMDGPVFSTRDLKW